MEKTAEEYVDDNSRYDEDFGRVIERKDALEALTIARSQERVSLLKELIEEIKCKVNTLGDNEDLTGSEVELIEGYVNGLIISVLQSKLPKQKGDNNEDNA
jgi:hypothetical protein